MAENYLKSPGIKSKGYGIICKLVMQDKRLSIISKAIYAYFCSYAGNGDTAFPSVKKICGDLCIKEEKTFRTHLKKLKELDYIRVDQVRNEKGIYDRNIYTIVEFPETVGNTETQPSGIKTSTVKNQHGQKPGRLKKGSNNNKHINNNNKDNNNRKTVSPFKNLEEIKKPSQAKNYEQRKLDDKFFEQFEL